jgi:hypothetical protein
LEDYVRDQELFSPSLRKGESLFTVSCSKVGDSSFVRYVRKRELSDATSAEVRRKDSPSDLLAMLIDHTMVSELGEEIFERYRNGRRHGSARLGFLKLNVSR